MKRPFSDLFVNLCFPVSLESVTKQKPSLIQEEYDDRSNLYQNGDDVNGTRHVLSRRSLFKKSLQSGQTAFFDLI